jgi:hypothetical protein
VTISGRISHGISQNAPIVGRIKGRLRRVHCGRTIARRWRYSKNVRKRRRGMSYHNEASYISTETKRLYVYSLDTEVDRESACVDDHQGYAWDDPVY